MLKKISNLTKSLPVSTKIKYTNMVDDHDAEDDTSVVDDDTLEEVDDNVLDDDILEDDDNVVDDASVEDDDNVLEDDVLEDTSVEEVSSTRKKRVGGKDKSKPGKSDNTVTMPALHYASNVVKERYEYKPVVRNQIVYVHPSKRVTSEILTKFELTEVISHRAKQIENGGLSFTDVGELTDPIEIAKKEIQDKKCPLCIVRMLTDVVAEKWAVNELGIYTD